MTEVIGTGPWRVTIIESERGWGQKVDEYRRFATKDLAAAFVRDYNKANDKAVAPDWYMAAQTPEYLP
jgi:hypothetical protein